MGSATLEQSTAITKLRYPDGKLPKALYQKFKVASMLNKREDWTGAERVVALQNENPQGISHDYQAALGSLAQGTYNRFLVSRVEYFGIARIKGQALRAVEGDEGALVDLWKNETEGVAQEILKDNEIFFFGNGSGVIGQFASTQTFTGTTVTLRVTSDVVKFSLGMRVQVVSDSTLSPTVRAGVATITALNRTTGVITLAAAWNTYFTGLTANDYLVRAGNYATSGTANVFVGVEQWLVGGSTPGTLYGLNRNTDPLRLASQRHDATGQTMEEAIIEASAKVNEQGAPQSTLAFAHPRDIANFKKALGSKVTYPKIKVEGNGADVSFDAIEIHGDEGRIAIVTSPFATRNKCYLLYPESWKLDAIKTAPHLLDYDGPNFLRVANDDAYEVRWGEYGNYYTNMPYANIAIDNFGL